MPHSMNTFLSAAREKLASGQPLSALPIADILCELEPQNLEYLLLRSNVLFELREFGDVIISCKKILGGNPYDKAALELLVKASFELGDSAECCATAEKILEIEPNNTTSFCYLAKCSELAGEGGRAVEFYNKALKSDPFCGEAITSLVERRLMNPTALLDLIQSLNLPDGAESLRETYKAKMGAEFNMHPSFGVPRRLIQLKAARTAYRNNNLREALAQLSSVLKESPFDRDAVCLYLCVLVDLKETSKLFEQAHFLSKSRTRPELALYAIGCFYFSLSNFERAGRYFSRATELDCFFAEAWIAYGHCYAKLEEGEQALSVYRRAMSLFPGLSLCGIFVGIQYIRVHQWSLATCFLNDALKSNPLDPLILNEIGILYMHANKQSEALNYFRKAYKNLPNPDNLSEYRDCIIFNLATALRKEGAYDEAIEYYSYYVKCRPNASHAHCALGFTYHLAGNLRVAITHYHNALSIKADSFCRDMLDRALASDFGHNVGGDLWRATGTAFFSPTDEVSFSTATKTVHPDSTPTGSTGQSPRNTVGRSLLF